MATNIEHIERINDMFDGPAATEEQIRNLCALHGFEVLRQEPPVAGWSVSFTVPRKHIRRIYFTMPIHASIKWCGSTHANTCTTLVSGS